jgi:hypothetical protein
MSAPRCDRLQVRACTLAGGEPFESTKLSELPSRWLYGFQLLCRGAGLGTSPFLKGREASQGGKV